MGEVMAVMEAAISSSLAHPNVVVRACISSGLCINVGHGLEDGGHGGGHQQQPGAPQRRGERVY